MRLWLPDRPGALGAVASRIGAVKGDVVGIEILEMGTGQAIDELVIEIPDATLVDLLVAEVRQVDGVQVEEVRPTEGQVHDPRLEGLRAAAALVEARSTDELLACLDREVLRALDATWVVGYAEAEGVVLRGQGSRAPQDGWIAAFVAGVSSATDLGGAERPAADVMGMRPDGGGPTLVAGRGGRVWRSREVDHLAMVARIFGRRWQELSAT